jgi:glutathione S-transferase
MLKLYFGRGSCALASHLSLEESGANYEAHEVNLAGGEQKTEEFLRINPKGRVPVLATDRGLLTETPAILLYIAQSFPAANLAPLSDPFELARLQAFNSYLCSTVHVAHAHAARGHRWTDNADAIEAMKQYVPQTMSACFDAIEGDMVKGPWVMGEQFSVCDPYLFTITRWLERDGVDFRRYPKVAAIHDAIEARPAASAILPQHAR